MEINTELINRAQKGDLTVISALYEQYHLSIFRYLYYRVGDRQAAEDLTSEVFLRMLRYLAGFHPPSATFQAWLFQIARNLATDYFRQAGPRNPVQLEENVISGSDDPVTTVEHSLTREGLRKALNRLTDEQRDVILLRFVAGMPIAEAAQSLNKSEDAIKGLQRRALQALREILVDWEVSYVE
ncbi:MAG TPA: sigma-70 family RNA polymerase sigma factor [Anaerolineales bacterium]